MSATQASDSTRKNEDVEVIKEETIVVSNYTIVEPEPDPEQQKKNMDKKDHLYVSESAAKKRDLSPVEEKKEESDDEKAWTP